MSLTKHNHRLSPWADLDILANRLSRTFSDSGVRSEGITADFDNGLLTVRLPKAEEAVSRKIEVARRN